jgi:hypothetical protein
MDAISTDASALSYLDFPPILLAASSESAMSRAEASVLGAGFRIADRVPIAQAQQRIEQQLSATALWLELDVDCGGPMDQLLEQLSRDVERGRYLAVVSATADLLDPIAARAGAGDLELIIDANDAERVSALAIAAAKRGLPLLISDIASENNAERLRQLSEEVSRIASTLARLSTGPGTPGRGLQPLPAGDVPALPVETVRGVIRARRLRARYFRDELFADPAWDMLLDLLQAEIAQLRVPVSSLCIAAAVPATTALRWLKTLVSEGIFVRRADPHDGRRVFVELAPEASQALRRYFGEIGPVPVI